MNAVQCAGNLAEIALRRGQRTQGAALFASESAIRDLADLGRLSIVPTVI